MAEQCLRDHSAGNYHSQKPLVSVVMIAYNLEKYLDKAVESVLNQIVDFNVELVIGEDCSTDRTREIALQLQQQYPHIIKVLLPSKNQGLTGNCIATHNACSGKYIALLDGDDFWTNQYKLKKQVTFLEKHPDFSGCAHQCHKIYDDRPDIQLLFGSQIEEDYSLKDMLSHRKFHTSSLLYRKEYWDKTGGIPKNISSNERALYPMLACFGKIHYFNEPMCVYRFSGYGLSSRIDHKELETDFNMLPWLKKIAPSFPIMRLRAFLHLCVYTYSVKSIPLLSIIKHFTLFSIYSFSYFPKNLGDIKYALNEAIKKIK